MNSRFFFIVFILLTSCKHESNVNFQYSNIDSIVVIDKGSAALYENARKITITNRDTFNWIYQSYINRGLNLKSYYAKLPINKYDLRVYRSDFKNDTMVVYHDLVRISNFGVIKLPNDIEPILDRIVNNK